MIIRLQAFLALQHSIQEIPFCLYGLLTFSPYGSGMRAFTILLLLIPLLMGFRASGAAFVAPGIVGSPGLLCRSAIASAEQAQAIPSHLMAAIGRVESGRRDEATGVWHPWPWAVNAEGQGYFFDSKAQAIAAVRAMQARGVRSIDVGCMQVNLMYHPDAFPGLEQAFDPAANTAYAARFMRQLFTQAGTWPKAVALYHSATPALAEPYARKVMAVWPEESRRPAPAVGLANAWGATLGDFMPVRRNLGSGGTPPAGATEGMVPAARGLDFYRSMPIALGLRVRGRVGRG